MNIPFLSAQGPDNLEAVVEPVEKTLSIMDLIFGGGPGGILIMSVLFLLSIIAVYIFGFALILLIISLALLIREIQISAEALQHHIADIEEHLKKK